MIDANDEASLLPAENLTQAPSRREAVSEQVGVGRQPPHSIEAEQGVIGCLLIDVQQCMGECLERMGSARTVAAAGATGDGSSETPFFYDLKHQAVFNVLIQMYDAREAVDMITLRERLRSRNQLETVGGLAYLTQLTSMTPSSANLSYYLEIVWQKYLLRKMLCACTDMQRQAYENEGEVDQLLDEVETRIHQINDERVGSDRRDMKALVNDAISEIEAQHQRKGGLSGVPTGFADLDKMTDGLHAGEVIVIAARPSMGKTSLAMNIVDHVVLEEKKPVGVFSLEMTAESLVMRMLYSRARMNHHDARAGLLAPSDFKKLTAAAGRMHKAPLYIDDTPGLSILQLRAKARRMKHQHDIQLIVVDYLQLLNSTSRRARDNRQQEIAEISSGVKALAKELKLPVIVLSQLNREIERDKNRKPRLSDLRESGAIEQDADIVALLFKANSDDDEAEEFSEGLAVGLAIAKQRNGPTGDVYLTFLKNYTKFESAARISPEDVPVD